MIAQLVLSFALLSGCHHAPPPPAPHHAVVVHQVKHRAKHHQRRRRCHHRHHARRQVAAAPVVAPAPAPVTTASAPTWQQNHSCPGGAPYCTGTPARISLVPVTSIPEHVG